MTSEHHSAIQPLHWSHAVEPGPTATALFLDGKSAELVERMSRAAPLCAHGESFGWYIRANGGAP